MINEHLVGTWWIYKSENNALYTYKGPSPPKSVSKESASFPEDAETSWMYLTDGEDRCYVRSSRGKMYISISEFCAIVNLSLLDDIYPGDVKQIEIFPSGNWVIYD